MPAKRIKVNSSLENMSMLNFGSPYGIGNLAQQLLAELSAIKEEILKLDDDLNRLITTNSCCGAAIKIEAGKESLIGIGKHVSGSRFSERR